MRSVVVVLPASTWAMMPMLRMFSSMVGGHGSSVARLPETVWRPGTGTQFPARAGHSQSEDVGTTHPQCGQLSVGGKGEILLRPVGIVQANQKDQYARTATLSGGQRGGKGSGLVGWGSWLVAN